VVIPVKDFVHAKQRLAGVLESSERRALSQAMVEDLLARLQVWSALAGVLLVSDDPAAGLLAYRYGASVLMEDGRSRGLNAAVSGAAEFLAGRGASHMLVLHGDLPCVSEGDLRAVAEGLPRPGEACVRLVPDRAGAGTNGLLCSLPPPLAFAYGRGSLRRHRRACLSAGVACQVMPLASFALDIDTPADLVLLQDVLRSAQPPAHKTAAVLREHRLLEKLQRLGIAGGAEAGPRREVKPSAR
jgi:2-phospho-L-lactate guanylyltransferase